MPTHRSASRRCRATLAALSLFAALAAVPPAARATSLAPLTPEAELDSADAAARGTVLSVRSYRDAATGRIWTDTLLRVDESFKGSLPAVLRLRHPGGTVGGDGERHDASPRFAAGEERLVFLARRPDGTATVLRGPAGAPVLRHRDGRTEPFAQRRLPELRRTRGARAGAAAFAGKNFRNTAADATDAPLASNDSGGGTWEDETVTASGLLTDAMNIPSRFIAPDRGEPIPYLVDADALPAGITLAQALSAVENALAAWTAVSSVKFKFAGVTSFGQAAGNVPTGDGRLRIQLHDNYGYISGATTLGVGGYAWTNGAPYFSSTGGTGGRVGAQEFHLSVRGYLVLKHTHVALTTLKTFEEVLCHEIGHTLGLAHSSETFPEPDVTKAEATMYFAAHGDGRSATLGAYDPPIVQKIHPVADTPPWVPARILHVVTATPQPAGANVNEITLAGYDRQTAAGALTWSTSNPSGGLGGFALAGTTLRFTATGAFSDAALDPATASFYAQLWLRAQDGVNASPWVTARVTEIFFDSLPAGASDGLPNSWMTTYWGNPDPAAGAGRGPNDDPDGDGLTNLQEFRLGTNPLDAASRLAVTGFALAPNQLTWNARPYEIYRLERSADLATWTSVGPPAAPTTGTATVENPADTAQPKQFLRVRHVW